MKYLTTTAAAALVVSGFGASMAAAGSLADPVVETVEAPAFEPVATAPDWTGFYGGLNLGYADIDTNAGVDGDNESYGVHIGYDYDFGQYVLGAELEYDEVDVDLDGAANVDSVTRLKLRGGYDLGRTLVYGTAGVAEARSTLGDETGEFIGIGVAYQVTDRFTVGGELLEHRFDDIADSGVDADATTFNIRGSLRF